MTGFNKVMRFCNTLQDYESAKNQGTITDDLFVVILQDKLAKFKGQTFDWSQNADLTALATKGELEDLAEEIASNERVWAEALNDLNERINEIGTGGGGGTSDIVVDAALSTTSTNAIQNKAVANALNEKADASSLAMVATSGSYNDLSNKPTIPSAVTESTVSGWGFTKNTGTYSKPSTGIPKTDLASAVQTSLGKADTALQSYTEQYKGTVTGVTINGTTKNPSNGVVDLGTVITAHQDISGKQDTLVSGTNIKTVNGESILGSGNIIIQGGDGASDIALSDGVKITIPSEIVAVVGDNMQIFWRSIVSANNPYIFDIYAVCSVGKSYPRYYEFNPTAEMVGESYNIDIYVKANNGAIIAHQSAKIKVVDTMTSPQSTMNILCIGASATAGGQWVGELNRRLTSTNGSGTLANPTGLGLQNISFVGRKVGTVDAINLEATGGWRVQDYASKGHRAIRFYVTGVDTVALDARYICNGTTYIVQEVNITGGSGNIRCTLQGTFVEPTGKLIKQSGSGDAEIQFTSYGDENFSPFWNDAEERIDFEMYADAYCGGRIDCLIWHCGVNDITSGDPSVIPTIITAFRNLLTAYHEQFPEGRVIISSVPIGSDNGGFAANYGANKSLNYFTFAKIAQLYAQALVELTQEEVFNAFVEYSPALEQFDAENNYPVEEFAVNNRSTIKEQRGTNAVHPIMAGSYQVADSIYRTVNAILWVNAPVIIEPIAIGEKMYIPKAANTQIAATTSSRGIVSFLVEEGKNYEVHIPKTGNSYAAYYAFGWNSYNGAIAVGMSLTEQYGVGDTLEVTTTFTAPKGLPYLYVCYTLDGGVPTLKKL